jgi:hypothetical protein
MSVDAMRHALLTYGLPSGKRVAEEIVAAAVRMRLDPRTNLPVFVPGAERLLRQWKADPRARVMIGTNGDPEVQTKGKLADVAQRAPGLLDGIAVVCTGHRSIDAGKPNPLMLFSMLKLAPSSIERFVFEDNRLDTGVEAAWKFRDGERPDGREHVEILPLWFDHHEQGLQAMLDGERLEWAFREIFVVSNHEQSSTMFDKAAAGATDEFKELFALTPPRRERAFSLVE